MRVAVWFILHSLIWNGKLARNENLQFPLNNIQRSSNWNHGYSINPNQKKPNGNANSTSIKTNYEDMKDNAVPENRIHGSSLSEISVNNLFNLITNPRSIATSLIILAAVVRYHLKNILVKLRKN